MSHTEQKGHLMKPYHRPTQTTTNLAAILEVPAAVYAVVRTVLEAHGYQHAVQTDTDGTEVIDMQGIALRAKGNAAPTEITITSLVSARTYQGRVDMALNEELTQMDLDKARDVVTMLQQAIEAAISDEFLIRFLTSKLGLAPETAGAALQDFREFRQGSRARVYPS